MNRLIFITVLCLGNILIGCASEESEVGRYYQEHSIVKVQEFLSVQDNSFLGRQTSITDSQGGLYIVDSGRDMIHKVDRKGDLLTSFGSRGQGPGEYQSIAGFWPQENGYLIYDYNSFKFISYDSNGKVTDEVILRENPVNPDSRRAYQLPLRFSHQGNC